MTIHKFSSNCFLWSTCHPKLSTGNWSDSISPVGLNSEPALDPLKHLRRGGRRDWGGTSIKKENFQQESQGGRAWPRHKQKRDAPLAEGSQRAAA